MTYKVSVGAKIDLEWPRGVIMQCISEDLCLSEPATKIWMKIDYTITLSVTMM